MAKSLAGDSFEATVNIAADGLTQTSQGMQKGKRLLWVATTSDDQRRQVFFGLGERKVRNEERTSSAYFSISSRVRVPRTARTRILASTTRALSGIPLLLAGSLVDPLVLLHQLVFAGAPR
jgi:hypothetical protein